MSDYIKFSPEQISAAKQTDMIDFLEQNEGFSFKKAGKEWHCVEHSSLVIMADRTGFAWNSKDICGANAIDYCMKIKNMDFKQSLQMIVGIVQNYVKAPKAPPKFDVKKEKLPLILPQKATEFKRAFAYLQKSRGIDANIISELMHEERIFQDVKNNVVFVGLNEDKKPAFACVRGTISNSDKPAFKGDCKNSDKNYGFALEGRKKSKVFVFEAPIDLLSHATLANLATGNKEAWKLHQRVALSGKSDLALENYLKNHPDVKEIAVCLDNDFDGKDKDGNPCNYGQISAKKIIEKYQKQGYTMINMPPNQGKDYNENLKIIQEFVEKEKTAIVEIEPKQQDKER